MSGIMIESRSAAGKLESRKAEEAQEEGGRRGAGLMRAARLMGMAHVQTPATAQSRALGYGTWTSRVSRPFSSLYTCFSPARVVVRSLKLMVVL